MPNHSLWALFIATLATPKFIHCKGQRKVKMLENCKATPPPTTTLSTTTPSSRTYSCNHTGWDGEEGCLNRTTPQLNNCI
uniref:Secreted protein n=1 Tax=Panagrolaimus sp. JU765 TaxID=591449 RepID=A0AC34QMK4_9BILA